MGAPGPLLHLLRAVVCRPQAAYRLLEQIQQPWYVRLLEGDDARRRKRRHGSTLPDGRAGAWGRFALGRPATTRS